MRKHKEADPALWKFGTQPIMMLVGSGRWQQLPGELYLGDLGFKDEHGHSDGNLLQQALVLHFDGEHKPWLPMTVSDINVQQNGAKVGWNSHLLRPYVPVSMADGWFAAPGARCLLSLAMPPPPLHAAGAALDAMRPSAPSCDVGPLVPGSSIPGLRWVPS